MFAAELRIRHATSDDSPMLAAVAAHLATPGDAGAVRARIESLLAHPDHLVLVAVAAPDEIVGWVHAFVARRVQTPPFVEIGGLVVAPGHRRFGVGSALCRRVELWVEELGLSHLRVRSRSDRAEAASFFDTMGFTRTKMQYVFDCPRPDPECSDA